MTRMSATTLLLLHYLVSTLLPIKVSVSVSAVPVAPLTPAREERSAISEAFLDALAETQRQRRLNTEAETGTGTETEAEVKTTIDVIHQPETEAETETETEAEEGSSQGRNTTLVILPYLSPSSTPQPSARPTFDPTSQPTVAETVGAIGQGAPEPEPDPEPTDNTTTAPVPTANTTTTTTTTTAAPTSEETVTVPPAWWSSGVRTNFDFGVPFNFSHVFFIGGVCDGIAPTNWYSQFVKAGKETIPQAEIVCSEEEGSVYSREFHLDALQYIEERVGDELNQTLVFTVAVGLASDWTPVVELLKKGMAFFHAKEDRDNDSFDLEAFGLVPEEVLYFYFRWNEEAMSEILGQELCRLKQGATSMRVAKIYSGGRNGALNYRPNLALEAFKAACSDTKVEILWTLESDQKQSYEPMLKFNPAPDVVMCTQDAWVHDILEAANKTLTKDEYNRMSATGWNFNPDFRHLVDERKILATVDQQVHYAHRGVWGIVQTVLDIVQETGLNSTKSIQKALDLGNSTTILTETLLISSDPAGYLIDGLLQGYDPDATPSTEVEVSTGLFDTTIVDMIPFEGKFQAVLWLRLAWNDPRLSWNPNKASGAKKVTLHSERIWTPQVFLKNQFSREDLYVGPATISHTGDVKWETNIFAEFLCDTTDQLAAFPFDSYNCSMDVGSPGGISLDQDFGFSIIYSDPHFAFETAVRVIQDRTYGDNGESLDRGNVAKFEIYFKRKPFTAWVRLILPAVLINMIGFISFWISTVQESVALGVTSFLCALAFRETVNLPDTADVTWTEVFIMVNVTYQASVLLIVWISYSNGGRWWKDFSKNVRDYHPMRLAKKAKKMDAATKFQDAFSRYKGFGRGFNEEGIPEDDLVVPDEYASNGHVRHSQGESSNGVVVSGTPVGNGSGETVSAYPRDEGAPIGNGTSGECGTASPRDGGTPFGNGSSAECAPAPPTDDVSIDIPPVRPKEYQPYNPHDRLSQSHNHSSWLNFLRGTMKWAEQDEEEPDDNFDWIGRWFVVPSYLVVNLTLIFGGWGFFNN